MQTTTFGRTGLQVSRLGVGTAEIGFELTRDQQDEAARVLNTALDNGINLVDTAACYGISEELIGATIAHRRDDYILATKAGHVREDELAEQGYEEWTGPTITASIERSLKRMKTDVLDVVQLHSCSLDILKRGEVIEALEAARDAGKTRFIGYSGDNEAAMWAVESGRFDTLQTSFNLVEQKARLSGLFEAATQRNMGIIVKRPIANASWGADASPSDYADTYWQRAAKMKESNGQGSALPDFGLDRILIALGFTFAHDAVDVAIVGTRNPDHMRSNIDMLDKLPLDSNVIDALHRRFEEVGMEWEQKG